MIKCILLTHLKNILKSFVYAMLFCAPLCAMKTISSDQLFECSESDCGYTCVNKPLLTAHKKIHLDKKSFVCTVAGCSKEFRWKKQLISHKKIHSGKKIFTCACCNKSFHYLYDFNRHNQTDKHKRREALQSSIAFSKDNQEEIASLKKPVTREKIFSCTYCNKSFFSLYHLNRHNETKEHKRREAPQPSIVLSEDNQEEIASLKKPFTGEKIFSCTCCNKIFPHLSHLRRHNETKEHKRRETLQPSIVLSEDDQEEIASLKHPVTPEKIEPLLADNTAPEIADDLRENDFHENYELLFSEKNYFTAENLEDPFQDYGATTFPTYSENDFYLTDSLDKQEQKSLYSGNDFYA